MKAKFLALAALVLGLASCSNEPENIDVNVGGEQDVTINVSLPETTRAVGTQNSAIGGIGNVSMADYDIRYILEVYNDNGVMVKERMVDTSDATTMSFNLRLIPNRNYTFVVWADFVANGSEDDLYYNTQDGGLRNVAIIPAKWNAMDEARDAYTGTTRVEDYDNLSTINVTLTRPFGKLRVVTTDIAALYGILPEGIDVDYNVPVYTAFDAFEAEPKTPETKQFAFKLSEDSEYADLGSGSERTLFADYIFGTESGTIQFDMDVLYADLASTTTINFNTQIPVDRNKLTTLKGNMLTDANDITITIDEAFDTVYTEDTALTKVTNTAELLEAIAAANNSVFTTIELAAGTYTGAFDIDGKKVILVGEDKNTTIIDGLVFGLGNSYITLRNLTLTNEHPVKSTSARHKADYFCMGAYAARFVVDNCIFNVNGEGNGDGTGAIMMGDGFIANQETYDLTVTNCVFNCDGERPIQCKTSCYINNNTFNDQYRYSVQVQGCNQLHTEAVVFTNNTINEPCKTSGKGYVAYVSVSKSQVVANVDFTIDGNTTTNSTVANQYDFVYDVNANVQITTCTMNGELIAPEQLVAVETGVNTVVEVQTINTAAELFAFAQQINNNDKSYKIIRLGADIDLQNAAWTPIGQTGGPVFHGVFDGNGKTIYNLNIDETSNGSGHHSSGLFGWLNGAVVKDLTIDGATVKGNHNVGVIAGYLETGGCTIENCHVLNATIECHHANDDACGDKCGGIVGYAGNNNTPIKNCTVVNSTISAGRDAGQIAGASKEANVIGCSATSVNVTANGECTGANIRNELIGRILL